MADTTLTLNAGSGGKNIAVDRDTNSPQGDYQYVKPVFGASGTYTKVTSSVGFPVNIVQNSITSSTVATNDSPQKYVTSVGLWDSTSSPQQYVRAPGSAVRGLRVDFPDIVVDSNNSTTSALSSPNTYTGTWTDVSAYGAITVNVFADQNSTANGMKFQFSSDGSNADIDIGGGFDYVASTGRTFQFDISAQYFRVVFTTATNQSAFRLQTLLHHHPQSITTIHRADSNIGVDRSATLTKSILMAQAAGAGDFIPVDATASGNLKIAIEENDAGNITINQAQVAGTATSVNSGNLDAGTQRVAIATNDINLAAMKTALEIIDDWDETNRAAVNVISGQVGIAGGTGVDGATVPRVSLATDIPLPAGTNNIGDVDVLTVAAGSNLIGDVGLSGARTSGGTTLYKNIDVDETEDQIKATAGQVYFIAAFNMTASPLYLHLYNATAATVTVGSTAPTLTFPIPTLATTNGAGFILAVPNGIAFGTAITVACTTSVDPTAASPVAGPAANGCVIAMGYA